MRLDLRHAAVGPAPALARQLRQRLRRRAIDHHLDVVERPIGMARGIDAMRIVARVGRRVPAPDREVEAAGEGDRIVDHDDLLVLRAAEGTELSMQSVTRSGVRQRSDKRGNSSRSPA